MRRFFIVLLVLLQSTAVMAEIPEDARVTVFERGGEVYKEVRIPSLLCTSAGTLLAFAEGRVIPSDHARNDILLRRSTDRGATWGDTMLLHADETKVFVNPCAVVLDSGRVLLMYQEFPHGFHARPMGKRIKVLEPGVTGEKISRTLLRWSDDDGVTWSALKDVTAGTKRGAPIVSTASGPGIGIQLTRGPKPGRILMPTNEGWWEDEERTFNVYATYSDDGGATWQNGAVAPFEPGRHGDEVQMVELSDGRVRINSRSSKGLRRLTALSADAGESWTRLTEDDALIEPRCMGSVLRYSWPEDGRSRILFVNPATEKKREHGTVRISYDEGETWPVSREIYAGGFAYSCLTRLDDGSIGLLYEADSYRRIDFILFSLAWLEQE